MTVQELINELLKIEDKEKKVMIEYRDVDFIQEDGDGNIELRC